MKGSIIIKITEIEEMEDGAMVSQHIEIKDISVKVALTTVANAINDFLEQISKEQNIPLSILRLRFLDSLLK